jgi:hypothetical protein
MARNLGDQVTERILFRELVERALAALMAVGIVLGSLFLWIGVPVLGMWIAGELTTSAQGFLFAVLGGIPLAMIATGFALFRLGAAYERTRDRGEAGPSARSAWLVSHTDERGSSRRARGPRTLVDVSMAGSAVLALLVVVVWFFFIAEMDLAPMQ